MIAVDPVRIGGPAAGRRRGGAVPLGRPQDLARGAVRAAGLLPGRLLARAVHFQRCRRVLRRSHRPLTIHPSSTRGVPLTDTENHDLPTDERKPTLTDTSHRPVPPLPRRTRATAHRRPARPRLHIDVPGIASRQRAAAHEEATPALRASAADVPALLSEVDRLWTQLARTRLRYANLVAAGRATLSASLDGDDADPLSYLRDELAHPLAGSTGERR